MSDIIVKFKPSGHKELIKAIQQLKLAQGGATAATKKHTKASNGALASSRLLGGSFATMRSHLLLYNFAMGLGIKQLIQFTKSAAKVQDMSRAFTTLSKTGEDSSIAVSKISGAVKGTMSQMDLFKQANNAMILGVTRNTDEMAEMFSMAQTLGAALGVDTAHAVESLITGIGRQSRLMLDNIGIIVKSDQAYQDYAKNLGITADKLTNAQKKQAFFTAAMDAARIKSAELGNQQLTARDQFNKFNATMSDFTNFIGQKSTPVVLNFLNNMGEAMRKMMETNLETAVRQLKDMGATMEEMAELEDLVSFEKAVASIDNFDSSAKNLLTNTIVNMHNIELETLGVTKTITEGVKNQFIEISGFQNISAENVRNAINKERAQRIKLKEDLTAASQDENKAQKDRIASEIDLNIKNTNILFNLLKITKERDNANRLIFDSFKQVSEEIDYQGESVEVLNEQIGESIGFTLEMVEMQDLLTKAYNNSSEGQLAALKIQIDYGRVMALNGDLTDKQIEGLIILEEKWADLTDKQDKNKSSKDKANKLLEKEIALNKQLLQSSVAIGKGYKNAGNAAVAAAQAAVAAKIQEAVMVYMAEAMAKIPFPASLGVPILGAAMAGALGSVLSGISPASSGGGGGGGVYGSFEDGGYVGGRRHSQGGTIIEAERGEFVMSRNAVESIGIETLNQMNQGGGGGSINVSVTGNVLTQDFVEGELAEAIKEAARRGSDFGLS